MRKVIQLTTDLSESKGLNHWRQQAYQLKQLKKLFRTAQNRKRGKASTEPQKIILQSNIIKAHQAYLERSQEVLDKASDTLKLIELTGINLKEHVLMETIRDFMKHAVRQIDQIRRRVIEGQAIPHSEKVFSIFEPHTEWISKGKAGVPVELGVKVCILEDQHQFILHHEVMEKKTDEQVAVLMVTEAQKRFVDLRSISFDKGFHSPENQEKLSRELDLVALPRKGKLSVQARELEESEAFRTARRKHSAVESAINALEVHGLDRCPDHGIAGFKRYVALSIVARNIQRIGALLQKEERERLQRKRMKQARNDAQFKKVA